MINTQEREVPQLEGISRATYKEKTGVKDRYLQSEDSQEFHCISKYSQRTWGLQCQKLYHLHSQGLSQSRIHQKAVTLSPTCRKKIYAMF